MPGRVPLPINLFARAGMLAAVFLLIVAGCALPPDRQVAADTVARNLVVPAVDSPLLERARLLAATEPSGNYLALLENGNEALLARIHLIRAAQSHIAIQTIIWADDETGRLFMFELVQAAKRGVRVQVLIDQLSSEQHIDIADFLAYLSPGLEIRLFNPVSDIFEQPKAKSYFLEKLYALLFKFHRLNHRMHNKTFIVDGLVGITGGRNYQNAYFDRATRMNYKDRDALCAGPVVGEMLDSFRQYWNSRYAVDLTDLTDVRAFREQHDPGALAGRVEFPRNGLFTGMEQEVSSPAGITRLLVDSLHPVRQVTFVADDPVKRERFLFWFNSESKITRELARLVAEASSSVAIQTPYLVLTLPAIALFTNLREQHPDIDIRISTNSLAATDSWHVYALSYKQKQTYLQDLNFRIYEFKPRPEEIEEFLPNYPFLKERAAKSAAALTENSDGEATPGTIPTPYLCLHSKSMVIDDEIVFVGSYNLDPRSENLNTEAGLVVRDREFARLVKEKITKDMAPGNAWVIAPKKLPLGLDLPNAVVARISGLVPFVDLWPFRYSSSFELIDGKAAVDVGHPDFYKNFRDVGSFPEINGENGGKEIGARGTKTFLSIVKPLL